MMPKISVIMSIYNTYNEQIALKAINSILDQTFDDIEFLICDDGSTDNTYEIISNHCAKDKRVSIIRNEINKGLAYSLNRCIKIAKGRYIARMDADDISLPNRLEKQYYFLEQNPKYHIIGSNAYLIDEKGRWGIRKLKEKPEVKDFLIGTQFMHPTVMIRKEVYNQLQGYHCSKDTLRGQDYDFFMRAYAYGYRGYNIQQPLFEFREDKNTYKRRTYRDRLNESKIRYRGFKKMGLLPRGIPFILKPMIVGLFPQRLLKQLRNES